MIKIAILGNPNSVWIKKFYYMLKKNQYQVKIFTFNITCTFHEQEYMKDIVHIDNSYIKLKFMFNFIYLFKEMMKFKPHIIWGHYITNYGFYCSLLPIKAKKVVSTWGSDINLKGNIISKIKRIIALNLCDVIIPSWADKDFLVKIRKYLIFKNKDILEVYWGIDSNYYKPLSLMQRNIIREKYKIPKDSFIITSIRHMKKGYNMELITQAFLEVNEDINDLFYIYIAGFYDDTINHVRGKFKDKNNYLIIDKFADKEVLNEIYNITNLGVSFLIHDMVGAPIMELLSTGGTPVLSPITTYKNFFSYKELDFYISNDINKESLKESLIKGYYDIRSHNSIYSKKNRNFAKKYDFDKQAQAILDKLSSLSNS